MTVDRAIEEIQMSFPRVYLACHTRHTRGRTSEAHLSPRDSTLLVHLDRARPVSVSLLARHMGLAMSTISEAASRLEQLGYLRKAAREAGDRRHVGLLLTPKGISAIGATSVLETARLRTVLRRLSKRDLELVAGGLRRLAGACEPS